MRKVCYVTGTRADFGLMEMSLRAMDCSDDIDLSVVATGMHLLTKYGNTYREIERAGLRLSAKIPVSLSGGEGDEMAIAVGEQLLGFTEAFKAEAPDLVMLLGDRGEMLAAAIAAMYLNIPIVHLHGGERSGTVDESIRHAISKLAHFHFVSTAESKERLVKMGECAHHVFQTGAPGLDAIYAMPRKTISELAQKYKFNVEKPFELIIFHPVVQQMDEAAKQMEALLSAVMESCSQPLILLPNADAGSGHILSVINQYVERYPKLVTIVHAPREDFLSLVACADTMIGNSSSGIIEAASLQTPVVNIGERQKGRERNLNVIDVAPIRSEIFNAIVKSKSLKGSVWNNCYGDGHATEKILETVRNLSLSPSILEKMNAY